MSNKITNDKVDDFNYKTFVNKINNLTIRDNFYDVYHKLVYPETSETYIDYIIKYFNDSGCTDHPIISRFKVEANILILKAKKRNKNIEAIIDNLLKSYCIIQTFINLEMNDISQDDSPLKEAIAVMNGYPLSPLTGEENEWNYFDEGDNGDTLYQNTRCIYVFKSVPYDDSESISYKDLSPEIYKIMNNNDTAIKMTDRRCSKEIYKFPYFPHQYIHFSKII